LTVYELFGDAIQIIVSEAKVTYKYGCILCVHDRSNKLSIPSIGCWVH